MYLMKILNVWLVFIFLTTGCSLTDKSVPADNSSLQTEAVTSSELLIQKSTDNPAVTGIARILTPISVLETPVPSLTFLPAIAPTPKEYTSPEDVFEEYGWTITQMLGHHQITLPHSFSHLPGDFPVSIYWAYNNTLSSAIGLDYRLFLGKQVDAIVYALEEAPTCLFPYDDARGIAITVNGYVIGAWIDAGTYLDLACALDGRTLQDITGLTWGQWLVETGVVNTENKLEKSIATISPEQIVHAYYEAINEHNYSLAYAYFTREELVGYLFANMLCCTLDGRGKLFHSAYGEGRGDYGIENIEFVEIEMISKQSLSEIMLEVTGTIQYYNEIPHLLQNGRFHYFITLKEEIENLGYRIAGIGTGP